MLRKLLLNLEYIIFHNNFSYYALTFNKNNTELLKIWNQMTKMLYFQEIIGLISFYDYQKHSISIFRRSIIDVNVELD